MPKKILNSGAFANNHLMYLHLILEYIILKQQNTTK